MAIDIAVTPDLDAHLDVVHGVLALALLGHQGLALLPQVRAHALTHGLQAVGDPAEQLVHARQVCGHTHFRVSSRPLERRQHHSAPSWSGDLPSVLPFFSMCTRPEFSISTMVFMCLEMSSRSTTLTMGSSVDLSRQCITRSISSLILASTFLM